MAEVRPGKLVRQVENQKVRSRSRPPVCGVWGGRFARLSEKPHAFGAEKLVI